MLNEIFASEKYIRPGQSKDVSYIVSKYLPIGSSKKEVIDKLNEMNQHYSDKGHIIYAGYGKQIHPMIPNPEVMIELNLTLPVIWKISTVNSIMHSNNWRI